MGGDETTRHAISGGMHQLLLQPDQRRLRVREPRRIPVAIEAMLRWVSPIQSMNRTGDVELRGQKIREGDKLLLLYPSANRDAAVFDRPERFEAGRFGGDGAHFCLGAPLARLELRVMFEELLRRLPELELARDAPLPMRPSSFITGIERMPVAIPGRG